MSTTIVETWATDIAQLGPIYPFAGSEGLLVVLAFAAWIGWHVWQLKAEREDEAALLKRLREEKGGGGGTSATGGGGDTGAGSGGTSAGGSS